MRNLLAEYEIRPSARVEIDMWRSRFVKSLENSIPEKHKDWFMYAPSEEFEKFTPEDMLEYFKKSDD